MKPDVAESDRKWLGPARGRALLILGDVSLDSLSSYLRIRVYYIVFVQVLLCEVPFVRIACLEKCYHSAAPIL
jgi:hypothetical protein